MRITTIYLVLLAVMLAAPLAANPANLPLTTVDSGDPAANEFAEGPAIDNRGNLDVSLALQVAAVTATDRVPRQLVGCWKRHVGATPVGTPPGVWEIEISKAGRLDAYTPGSRCGPAAGDFNTKVSAVADRFTIGSVPVCPTKGIYNWKVSGSSLTLRAVADNACAPRLILFVGIWKKT